MFYKYEAALIDDQGACFIAAIHDKAEKEYKAAHAYICEVEPDSHFGYRTVNAAKLRSICSTQKLSLSAGYKILKQPLCPECESIIEETDESCLNCEQLQYTPFLMKH